MQLQKSDTIKELKLRQNYENRLKDSQKQIENREKEIETLRFQYNNIKDQLALLERTVNEQKVRNILFKLYQLFNCCLLYKFHFKIFSFFIF